MTFNRSVWIVALLCALAAIGLGACGGDDGSDTSTGASTGGEAAAQPGEGKKIAFILPSLQNDYYLAQQAGAEEVAAKYPGADVSIVAGTGDGSGADLIAKVEDALTKQVDVIAMNSSNPDPLNAVLAKAAGQGAKVVLYDTPMPDFKEQISWVGADNYLSGKLAGEWLVKKLPEGGKVGILHCFPGIKISDDRVNGFKEAIAGSELKVVATLDPKCDRAKGRSVMEDMISAHPDLAAVYSISDTQTLGAIGALPKGDKAPVVVSIDAQKEAVEKIIAGDGITASVRQNPKGMGAEALETSIKVADGETVPKEIKIDQLVVDESNAAQYKDE